MPKSSASFAPVSAPKTGGWLYLQRLIQKLRQVIRDGGLADHQRRAGFLRGGLQLRRLFAGKRNNGNVLGGGIRFQRGNGAANVIALRFQVHHRQHRAFALRAAQERRQIVDGLNAIIQVLQPVHQLAARQQFFVENERERLRHANNVECKRRNCKTVFSGCGLTSFLQTFDPPMTTSGGPQAQWWHEKNIACSWSGDRSGCPSVRRRNPAPQSRSGPRCPAEGPAAGGGRENCPQRDSRPEKTPAPPAEVNFHD